MSKMRECPEGVAVAIGLNGTAVGSSAVLVAFDTRDAHRPPLRGWGRYAAMLEGHLPDYCRVASRHDGGAGPEIVFEQLRFARQATALGADVLHAPNCFLPLRRSL